MDASSLTKLFIGGLNAQTTTDALRQHFGKYGRLVDAVVMCKLGRPRGFGFVTFKVAANATAALAEQHWLGGRFVDVKRAVPGTEQQPEEACSPYKLFVGGLPQDASIDELRARFAKYGPVADAVVMTDRRSKRSRGFGFVRFASGAEGGRAAEAVLQDKGHHWFGGKQVEVRRATPAMTPKDDDFSPGSSCATTAASPMGATPQSITSPVSQQPPQQPQRRQQPQSQSQQQMTPPQHSQQLMTPPPHLLTPQQLLQQKQLVRDLRLQQRAFTQQLQQAYCEGRLGLWGAGADLATLEGAAAAAASVQQQQLQQQRLLKEPLGIPQGIWAPPFTAPLMGPDPLSGMGAPGLAPPVLRTAPTPASALLKGLSLGAGPMDADLMGTVGRLETSPVNRVVRLETPSVNRRSVGSATKPSPESQEPMKENRPVTANRSMTPTPGKRSTTQRTMPPGLGSPMKVELSSAARSAGFGLSSPWLSTR